MSKVKIFVEGSPFFTCGSAGTAAEALNSLVCNLRLFSVALLISAIPFISSADPKISLNKGDFVAAEKTSSDGETTVSVKLSKSGKAKSKKLNEHFVDKNIHT